ncbi:MAG: hypothetical protein ACYTDY_11880, partial [Planctomycetota bacterium]
FLTKGARDRSALRRERLAEFAKTPPVYIQFNRVPDAPRGDPTELPNKYLEGDRVTLRRLDMSANLAYYETSVDDMKTRRVRDLFGLTYDVTMVDREGEKVVQVDGEHHVHEGRYDVKSYIVQHQPLVETLIQIEAKFKTDRLGRLVPGSFAQTGGPTLNPPPTLIGDRHFGVLPDHSVRHGQPGETWGTETLPDPFAKYVIIDGRPLPSLPLQRRREGGWRITGGELTKEHDGRWARNSSYNLKLRAVENGWLKNTTYGGQPADISYGIECKGSGIYMLLKQVLVRVDDLAVDIEVRVKTATMRYEWRGHSSLNFEMFKDP